MIVPDGACHSRPRKFHTQTPHYLISCYFIVFFIHQHRWIPGKGKVAYVGLVGVMHANGEIIIAPVSVCHQVSTIGQRFFPTKSLNQCHASSLMGSPTDPKTRNEDKSCEVTYE